MSNRLKAFLSEAARRRVFRTAGVYLVAVWGLSQGAIEVGPFFGAPEWIVRALVVGAVALLPVVVILAWMFDIGRHGIVRDPVDAHAHPDPNPYAREDDEIANMSTVIDGDAGQGAVIARWSGAGTTQSAIFVEEFQLGRAHDCRVRFYDPLVSRQHARVYFAEGEWRIEDLGSRNGTLVDGESIDRVVLPEKCEVRVNEAGPVLHFERVSPGAELHRALAAFPPGPRVAHVRNASSTGDDRADRARDTAGRKR